MFERRRSEWTGESLFDDPSVPGGVLPRSGKEGAHPSGAPRPEVGVRLLVTWIALAAALFALLLFATDGYARRMALETRVHSAPQIAAPLPEPAIARADIGAAPAAGVAHLSVGATPDSAAMR
ncbi:MAG TPA: hypothetical protein PLR02_10945 [Rhodocyclaceae bacterium]|nr:hypothetical protein [Rhodocyclaceae bacterium]